MLQKFENEKALKERAQQMEDNERRERIAACAQLLAIQQHTETVIGSASATSDREVSELKSKLADQKELIAELKVRRMTATFSAFPRGWWRPILPYNTRVFRIA